MRKLLLFSFFLFSLVTYAQGEANIWYFGRHAGLDFNSGSPVALKDGQLDTDEGCATLSDSSGQLLFYTDGVTVWNKKHQIMANGTGLLGHFSSTQSATIVQKPNSSNLFYIFTIDAEKGANGFQYSIVDITLNNGLGDVTNEKNILVYAPTCEKISIVKKSNNTEYWIVTHGWGNNIFYTYSLTAAGFNPTPIISNVGDPSDKFSDLLGYMKISPDGSKLAMAYKSWNVGTTNLQLFDFNTTTGLVTNPKILSQGEFSLYGVEFSPNSEVLYTSCFYTNSVYQYDLNAVDIPSSKVVLKGFNGIPGGLQLGPDGKIYVTCMLFDKLSVISSPNTIGQSCDLQVDAVDLGGRAAVWGLPAFNQSIFFNPAIEVDDTCIGQVSQFKLDSNQVITSASWDFGDGNASTDISPNHMYTNAGTYIVSAQITSSTGTSTKTKDVVISVIPTATKPNDLLVCDDNNDGLHVFDLTKQNLDILNGQDPNLYSITYLANNVPIPIPTTYINAVAYQQETITAEVSNKTNGECKSITTFEIDVFDTPLPNLSTAIPNLTSCDNTSVGTDIDGKVIFDLTQRGRAVLKGQSSTQFLASYYKDAGLTQPILNPTIYQNTNPTETIFVKVINKDYPSCTAITSFKIEVLVLPVIASVVDLKQCDDNIDGFSVFNMEEAIGKITANSAIETIAFYPSLADAHNNANAISNTTAYTNLTVSIDKVFVRVTNSNDCFRIAQLNLIVSTTQIPSTFSKTFIKCDDAILGTNTDGIASFDFSEVTQNIQDIFPSGQLLDITYYQNVADALAEKNAIVNISNYRNVSSPKSQNIYIRVDSKLNNDCLGLGGYITLIVEPIPIVKSIAQNHCDDNQDGQYGFDTSAIQTNLLNGLTNVTISYYDQNNNTLSSPLPNPFLTGSQTLKVVVTNTTAKACSFDTTLQFIVDDLPEVFPIAKSLTTICDDETDPTLQDGKYAFDTSGFQNAILGAQTGMTVTYFDANNNALSSPLPNPFVTTTQNIKVEVVNPINPTCSVTTIIPFVVHPLPIIQLTGDELVCSDLPTFTKSINAGLLDETQKNSLAYSWILDGVPILSETNYDWIVNKKGIYKVETTNSQGCSRTRTITVNASDKASVHIDIVDLSSENSITVLATGAGDYVFSLDNENGDYQTNNIFTNVPAGIHTVFVKDLNGCGIVPQEVTIFGIPNYFTPNQDGYNDTWNLKGVNTVFNAKTTVRIFDRYGKLIKEISPMGDGWDGTYVGQQMPATDYWYSVQLQDGRIFKGHFALKR